MDTDINKLKKRTVLLSVDLRKYRLVASLALLMGAVTNSVTALYTGSYVSGEPAPGRFLLASAGSSVSLYASKLDHPGVLRVVEHFRDDIEMVTGTAPGIILDARPVSGTAVVIGTIGKSPLIDGLVRKGKLDVTGIAGRWETFLVQVIDQPFEGVETALVIAGSDKRGTIYGMFDVSSQMGVSPWYFWADVPVKKKDAVYILPGRHSQGEPAVQYRGIFINDEAPALAGWAYSTFGGFNHEFYRHVFELILRLKGNYLWPAMWGRAFYDDDPQNPVLANEYGIVIGTSHHEPLMRAHDEWRRYGEGPWNYEENEENLRAFWTEGMERMGDNESVINIGMRGDGDMPMSQGTAIALLEKIVKDQREIISDVTGQEASGVLQMWALYKEVQDYYDKGMRVPEDVILLLCDDNWGNIRKLPLRDSTSRLGGYGIYYHFDYVGGPRNYKWLNTNQIERIWEQMHLAYQYGVDRLWVVNVGDIKPMEFPIEFFLDYAWDPGTWPAGRLPEYYTQWAEQQFGPEYAREIGSLIKRYTRFNSRRKPEMLSPRTYSLVSYLEAERVVEEYNRLAGESGQIYEALPAECRDAYYQLVHFPVLACANLNELYVAAAKNSLYAGQKRAAANEYAARVRELFAKDSLMTEYYHTELAGGKWKFMMSQTHIGYTYWQEPRQNNMPAAREIDLPQQASMGVGIEGSDQWWPEEKNEAVLPEFDPWHRQSYYIEVFNQGKSPFEFSAEAGEDWVRLEPAQVTVGLQERVWVSIDWENVPAGNHSVPIRIRGPGNRNVTVRAIINNPPASIRKEASGFIESNGYISMEAAHFSKAHEQPPVRWQVVPGLGRTLSGITPMPVTAPPLEPGGSSPRLEYPVYLTGSGTVTVRAHLAPTLNFHNTDGLRYAVSFDDQEPQVVNMHPDESTRTWEQWVGNNINVSISEHHISEPGRHILNFWMVDPGVVLEKLEIVTGELPYSYLGPPESRFALPENQP